MAWISSRDEQGVTPTINVPMPLEYSAGQDPQLEHALEPLARSDWS